VGVRGLWWCLNSVGEGKKKTVTLCKTEENASIHIPEKDMEKQKECESRNNIIEFTVPNSDLYHFYFIVGH